MLYLLYALLGLILFFLGASLFSFVGVLVYRVPRHISFISGRSRCDTCGKALKASHMIPVFSYLFLRGRCGCCGAKIPLSCLLLELAGGGASLLCALRCGLYAPSGITTPAFLSFICLLLFFCVLAAVAVTDAQTQEIPDGYHLALLILAISGYFLRVPDTGIWSRIIGAVAVSLPLFLITLFIPGAFGGGDIKLMAAAGLFLGWKLCVAGFLFGLLSGGAYGVYLLLSGKKGRKEHFAFGPFLCAGMALSVFCGNALADWYISLL